MKYLRFKIALGFVIIRSFKINKKLKTFKFEVFFVNLNFAVRYYLEFRLWVSP